MIGVVRQRRIRCAPDWPSSDNRTSVLRSLAIKNLWTSDTSRALDQPRNSERRHLASQIGRELLPAEPLTKNSCCPLYH